MPIDDRRAIRMAADPGGHLLADVVPEARLRAEGDRAFRLSDGELQLLQDREGARVPRLGSSRIHHRDAGSGTARRNGTISGEASGPTVCLGRIS